MCMIDRSAVQRRMRERGVKDGAQVGWFGRGSLMMRMIATPMNWVPKDLLKAGGELKKNLKGKRPQHVLPRRASKVGR